MASQVGRLGERVGVWVWVGEGEGVGWVGQAGWQVHRQIMLQRNGLGELSVFGGLGLV